jgi:DNA polymerase I
MKKLLLIDSHALIHRMYHAMAPLTTAQGEPIGAIYGLSQLLLKMLTETVKPDYVAACFDRPEPTFRKEAYTEYKAHRQPTPSDLISQLIKSREVFAHFKIKCFELAGFEADDLIATLATKLHEEKDLQVTILSGDRDLLQLVHDDHIVVELFKNGGGDTIHMNEQAVLEKYGLKPIQIIDLKGLIGDPSDNIPGVMNVGEKTATPLLKEFGTVEGVFENLVIVPAKVAKKLEGQQEIAMLSKKLATLEHNAPIFLDSLEDLRALPLDRPELIKYFESLGFVSLVRRMNEVR